MYTGTTDSCDVRATAMGAAVLGLLAVVLGAILVFMLEVGEDRRVGVVRTIDAEYPRDLVAEAPLFFAEDAFYVSLDGDDLVALYAIDPHPLSRNEGCIIEWVPNFEFQGRTGWFRDQCRGSTYDPSGSLAIGPSPRNLDRFAIEERDGYVYVDTQELLCARFPDYEVYSEAGCEVVGD